MSLEQQNQKVEIQPVNIFTKVFALVSGWLKNPTQELQDPQKSERTEKLKDIKLKAENLSSSFEKFDDKSPLFNYENEMIKYTADLHKDISAIFEIAEPINILPDYEYTVWKNQMNSIREIFDFKYQRPEGITRTTFYNYRTYMLKLIEEIQAWSKEL